ncbi:uncharacterized protein NECHADRAFT_90758 [Fusarium vanettenii 77-13-4]|uniref:C2H2-type domain-containing protein n=1 Tax=Fusarium vanettenii (strain ATCC MYA-4622 / CBS 123669 / FGSC 9596 / NRRL 45880 / 77-13-4) TaxID=660122 RepID=C7Z6I7_FUSV7|nr:uncharacterized protein NECHADRAFT_90758 [Fusarium vanettenii 77-13-4]EEU40701.1 hypothetical protein NECHADRAFT_90758 [Fusarium vanettenii 77-13-4]
MIFDCGTCQRMFPSGCKARNQHCQATGHSPPAFECDTCCFYFDDEHDRRDHMDLESHWIPDAPECSLCYFRAPTLQEVKNHEFGHHFYCGECNREFQNLNNIRQHLKSRRHLGSGVTCPFCEVSCGSATGLVYHLEGGSCPRAPLNRDKMYRVIRERDPNGVISIKALEWYGDRIFEVNPTDAWNSQCEAFECYLCHRLFGTLYGLRSHLASPKHQQKLYHCPSQTCHKEFITLAALINHLESETCRFIRFTQIQTDIKYIVSSNRIIEFGSRPF